MLECVGRLVLWDPILVAVLRLLPPKRRIGHVIGQTSLANLKFERTGSQRTRRVFFLNVLQLQLAATLTYILYLYRYSLEVVKLDLTPR